jgi:hypothetical protein
MFYVVYYGQGSGYEQVVVNNQVVCKKKTIWWYAPEFEFWLVRFRLLFKYEFGHG